MSQLAYAYSSGALALTATPSAINDLLDKTRQEAKERFDEVEKTAGHRSAIACLIAITLVQRNQAYAPGLRLGAPLRPPRTFALLFAMPWIWEATIPDMIRSIDSGTGYA